MTISNETPLSLIDATKLFANNPSPPSVYRWAQKGVMGVKLESRHIGGRKYTSREAVDRFLTALNQTPAERASVALDTEGC
jgi:hypothetical protein